MRHFYTTETVLAAALFSAATIIFGVTRPWRASVGKILFFCLLNITIVLLLIVASYSFGSFANREIVRFLIYTLTFLNSLVIFAAILAAQIAGTKKGINYGRRSTDYPRNDDAN